MTKDKTVTMSRELALFESILGKKPDAYLNEPVYQVTESEVVEFARAVLAQEAGHVEEPIGMVVQCRYPRDSRYWEDGTPDELGLGTEYYEVRTLYTSPPAPVAVPDGWKLVPIEPTEAMLNVLHDRVLISVNSRKQEASILNDKAWWKAVVDSAPTRLDKVKELNQ